MYKKKNYPNIQRAKIINSNLIPKNIKFNTITFFYKDNQYNQCHKDDFRNNIYSKDRIKGEMILNNMLDKIEQNYSNQIYFIKNNNNLNKETISDNHILNIRAMS